VIAAETRAILDLNHDFMLKQMVGTHLDMSRLLAPKSPGAMPPLPPDPGVNSAAPAPAPAAAGAG